MDLCFFHVLTLFLGTPLTPLTPARRNTRSRPVVGLSVFAKTSLEFIRGVAEETVPDVRLKRSPNGGSGTANFRFVSPSLLEDSGEVGDVTGPSLIPLISDAFPGLYMVDEEGVIQTVDVNAKFINGNLEAIEANYFMKSVGEWDRFMRFMERYASENGLGFQKVKTLIPMQK